ncbi:MAG: CRISPR-associated helicase Cas3' [Chloroflexi bacterium]|nr:CRISPR-associated helicase Cas3' [Chloroflexota bacterium]MBK6712275.1 CRISPR-associated helicase Cas3' [Chloroflexota bacterium]
MSKPYVYQQQVQEALLQGQNIILQAPTGAGKTRAALTPFLDTFWDASASVFPKKCVYIVPMRVLANQFTEEVRKKAARYERIYKRQLNVGRQTGEYREDPEFRAAITFATIDQVLSSWLMHPYSLSARKGNLNTGAFVGSYLIFDEFHLFDPDSMLPTTLHMLKTLKGVSPFVLMTATFSQEMLQELAQELGATAVLLSPDDLQKIPSQHKTRTFHTVDRPLVGDDDVFIDQIVAAHLAQESDDQRSLVVCNQVERAQRVYQALTRHPDLTDVTVRLLHSRFLRADRQKIEAEIRREFNKERAQHTQRSMILVGTQVVEVGLDMSSRALHTELAPAAAVLQRAGRCARYEGEEGHVYVYRLEPESYAPYHNRYAAEQCDLTWEWLQTHQDHHLSFQDEQALINHAHTPSDRNILKGLKAGELDHEREIYVIWRGDGNRGEAQKLIRNIQAVSIVVHPEPDKLVSAPFKVESFSLFPGTLHGKFKEWQKHNNATDEFFDEGHLEWLIRRLEELPDSEEDAQGNQVVRYGFKDVTSSAALHGPLFAVNPALVGYTPEMGLTLYPGAPYTCSTPEQDKGAAAQSPAHSSRLESYCRHIELVHEAFRDDFLRPLAQSAVRLEKAFSWSPGIIAETAHLVICLHDVGKLNNQWQQWVRNWQKQTGQVYEKDGVYAHWDGDGSETHRTLERKLKRQRPHHAIEGAIASIPLLEAVIPESCEPLLRAAFTAVARHHTTFASEASNYRLIPTYRAEIDKTLQLPQVPVTLFTKCQGVPIEDRIEANLPLQRELQENYFIRETNQEDMCSYMLLVRALRLADQKGTERGSRDAS